MSKLSAPDVLQPIQGTQVSYIDWNQLVAFMEQMAATSIALSQGIPTLDALPPLQPVTCVFPGSGLSVAVGGTDNVTGAQWALCQGIMCASVGNPVGTQYNFTIAAAPTGSQPTRIDALVCQPIQQQVTTVTRNVEQVGGSKIPTSIPVVIQGLAFEYIQGPSSGGNPTIPAGWEKFAHIAVANGATALTDADLTGFFPYMNQNAFTTTTEQLPGGVPAEGSNVTFTVNDTSVWAAGDFGYIVGPGSANGFLFEVVSTDDNALTMTITNINTLIQGSGILPVGSYVLAAALAPVCCTTTTTTIPVYGGSVTLNVTNSSDYPAGGYGTIIGRVFGQSFYFQVLNNLGSSIHVQLIGIGQGGFGILSGAASIAVGSVLLPSVPPGLVEEDQDNGNILNPTVPLRVKKGTVNFGSGTTHAVAFFQHNFGSGSVTVLPYSGSNTYGISLAVDTAGVTANWSSQTANGFSITTSAACNVLWTATGY